LARVQVLFADEFTDRYLTKVVEIITQRQNYIMSLCDVITGLLAGWFVFILNSIVVAAALDLTALETTIRLISE